jgi:tetratricopeptide (TPR) repeat protein
MMPDAALALLQEGDPAGALALLEVAGEQQSNAEALVVRGMVQLANHRPEQALPVLRQAVALGDTRPPTLLNLALAEQQAGDTAHAFRLMQELERLLPDWDERRYAARKPCVRRAGTRRQSRPTNMSWKSIRAASRRYSDWAAC